MAFVFGSIAREEAACDSDVDVCVLGDVSLVEVVAALAPLHERLGRVVNSVAMTLAGFRKQRKGGEPLRPPSDERTQGLRRRQRR